MKKIALLLLTIIFAAGCSATKKVADADASAKDISFEYEAITRGNYKKIIVTKDSIVTIKDHQMKDVVTTPLKASDWNYLVSESEKTDPAKLETLVAPSNKNHSDGAMAASLKVIKQGKMYSSSTFDHMNPPAEIANLVNRIVMLSDLKNK